MHQIIYAIVEGQTRDDALAARKAAFDHPVGGGPEDATVFDYMTFDDHSIPWLVPPAGATIPLLPP